MNTKFEVGDLVELKTRNIWFKFFNKDCGIVLRYHWNPFKNMYMYVVTFQKSNETLCLFDKELKRYTKKT